MSKKTLFEKRLDRKTEAWVLFIKKKIDHKEYFRLLDMITSTEEDLSLAYAIIREKFRKKSVDYKVDKSSS